MASHGTRRKDDKQSQLQCYVFPALALDGSGGVSIAHVAATHDDSTAHSVWPCCVKPSVLDNAFDSDFAATLLLVTQNDGRGQRFTTDKIVVVELELIHHL